MSKLTDTRHSYRLYISEFNVIRLPHSGMSMTQVLWINDTRHLYRVSTCEFVCHWSLTHVNDTKSSTCQWHNCWGSKDTRHSYRVSPSEFVCDWSSTQHHVDDTSVENRWHKTLVSSIYIWVRVSFIFDTVALTCQWHKCWGLATQDTRNDYLYLNHVSFIFDT